MPGWYAIVMPFPPPPEPPPQPLISREIRNTTAPATPARKPLLDASDTNKRTSPIPVLLRLSLYVPDFMPHLMMVLRSIQVKTASRAIPMSAIVTRPANTSGIRKK